jgi:hypothetical protein
MNQRDDDDYVGVLRRAIDEITDSIQLYAWMRTRYAAFQALLAETRGRTGDGSPSGSPRLA